MRASENKNFTSIMKSTIKGIAFSVMIFFIMIVIFSIIITKIDVSDGVIQVLTLSALGISSFFCSFINQRGTKQRGIIVGAISGTEIFLIIFIIGLFGSNGVFTALMLKKMLTIILAGLLGGILSANSKKKYK